MLTWKPRCVLLGPLCRSVHVQLYCLILPLVLFISCTNIIAFLPSGLIVSVGVISPIIHAIQASTGAGKKDCDIDDKTKKKVLVLIVLLLCQSQGDEDRSLSLSF